MRSGSLSRGGEGGRDSGAKMMIGGVGVGEMAVKADWTRTGEDEEEGFEGKERRAEVLAISSEKGMEDESSKKEKEPGKVGAGGVGVNESEEEVEGVGVGGLAF